MTDPSDDANDVASHGDAESDDDTGGTDTADEGNPNLERAVEAFLRDTRRVYEEYEADYLDPDAALWTIEGRVDALEDAFDERGDRE